MNPTQESINARNKFLEECKKLKITEKDGVIFIELEDLDLDK